MIKSNDLLNNLWHSGFANKHWQQLQLWIDKHIIVYINVDGYRRKCKKRDCKYREAGSHNLSWNSSFWKFKAVKYVIKHFLMDFIEFSKRSNMNVKYAKIHGEKLKSDHLWMLSCLFSFIMLSCLPMYAAPCRHIRLLSRWSGTRHFCTLVFFGSSIFYIGP